MNVLLVCTGNTCTSVMAEAILQDIASRQGMPLQVRSAGLHARDGERPTWECISALRRMGLEVASHQAARLRADMVDWADVVLCMHQALQARLLLAYPQRWNDISMLPMSLREDMHGYHAACELRMLLLLWVGQRKFF